MSIDWDYVKKKVKEEQSVIRAWGLPEWCDLTVTEYGPTRGVEVAPKWDVPEKIVIVTATTGAFLSKRQNPNLPIEIPAIRDSTEEVIKAGGSSVHIHARKDGYSILDPTLMKEILGPLKEKYPNIVYDCCLVPYTPEQWEKMIEFINMNIVETVPVNPSALFAGDCAFIKPPHILIEKTRILQEAGIKPQLSIYNDGDIDNANRYLIKTGLLEKPYYWNILAALPGWNPMYDPKTMMLGLIRTTELIYKIDPEPQIIVSACGRASSYLGTLAILMGFNIRVGMEDTVWQWPHKDDRIKNNAQCFLAYKKIASELGREIATPDEYRKLIGLKK